MSKKRIDVTAAILVKDGLILLARRMRGERLAGKWEFPGGKLDPGETPEQCLERELMEEFGIESRVGAFVAESVHDGGDAVIRLLAYQVEWTGGTMKPVVHDRIDWVSPAELASYDLAPADMPIAREVAALSASNG